MAKYSVVYYVFRDGKVKIGTSQNVHRRMQGITKTTGPVHLLAVEPGGYYLESKRHKQFKGTRISGSEWFQMSGSIESHISDLISKFGHARCNCPAASGRKCPAGM